MLYVFIYLIINQLYKLSINIFTNLLSYLYLLSVILRNMIRKLIIISLLLSEEHLTKKQFLKNKC